MWWSVQSGAERRSPYARGQPLWSAPLGGALDDVRTVLPAQGGYSDQTGLSSRDCGAGGGQSKKSARRVAGAFHIDLRLFA